MNAYITGGFRTAVGKAKKGGFRFTRPDDLAVEVINHLVKSVEGLTPEMVDDMIVGNAVPEAEQGMQMGRMISLMSLGKEVPGMIVNRYCGSGVEAINIASARIHAGMADCIIAGGTESMSLVPMMGHKTALNFEVAKQHPEYYTSMGLTAEEVAKDYDISRQDMDEFALRSNQRAIDAIKEGRFKEEIVPITVNETYVDEEGKRQEREFVVDTDEGPRAGHQYGSAGQTTTRVSAGRQSDGGQLFPNLRRGRLCASDVRETHEATERAAAGPHDELRRGRSGPPHYGHRPGESHSEGAGVGRTEAR